jgi:hypothetical protein
LEALTDIVHATLHLQAGFRFAHSTVLAGAPLALEFFVRNLGAGTVHVAVGGDRARGRPDFFSFSANLRGWQLADPASGAAYLGGPVSLVSVAPCDTYRQTILLNEFLRIEDVIARLPPGGHDELMLTCERLLPCGASEAAAFDLAAAPKVKAEIACTLRRDDSALLQTLDELATTILAGAIERREPALAELFASRAPAREQLLRIAAHPDRNLAERARRVLATLGG